MHVQRGSQSLVTYEVPNQHWTSVADYGPLPEETRTQLWARTYVDDDDNDDVRFIFQQQVVCTFYNRYLYKFYVIT